QQGRSGPLNRDLPHWSRLARHGNEAVSRRKRSRVADYSHPLLPKHASFRSPAPPPVTRSKRSRAVVVVEVTMHLMTEDRSAPSHLRTPVPGGVAPSPRATPGQPP